MATVEAAGSVKSAEITVKEASDTEIAEGKVKEQSFEVKITLKSLLAYNLAFIALGTILIVLLGYLGYRRFWKKTSTSN